ncbi:sulfurtransferase complex subunit TusC [Thalassotalea fusca]
MNNSIALINTCAPLGSTEIKDSIDVAMIMGSYEQDVHLYFIGDGVYQLMANQQPDLLQVKDVFKTFAAFEFYDIEHLYVCEESLMARGLTETFHVDGVVVLSKAELKESIRQHNTCLRF